MSFQTASFNDHVTFSRTTRLRRLFRPNLHLFLTVISCFGRPRRSNPQMRWWAPPIARFHRRSIIKRLPCEMLQCFLTIVLLVLNVSMHRALRDGASSSRVPVFVFPHVTWDQLDGFWVSCFSSDFIGYRPFAFRKLVFYLMGGKTQLDKCK